jgi:hypothetical protein
LLLLLLMLQLQVTGYLPMLLLLLLPTLWLELLLPLLAQLQLLHVIKCLAVLLVPYTTQRQLQHMPDRCQLLQAGYGNTGSSSKARDARLDAGQKKATVAVAVYVCCCKTFKN